MVQVPSDLVPVHVGHGVFLAAVVVALAALHSQLDDEHRYWALHDHLIPPLT